MNTPTSKNMFWKLTLIAFFCHTIQCKVITLKNNTHFVCVVENEDSAIYVEPVALNVIEPTHSILENQKLHGWRFESVFNTSQGVVTDHRFADFSVVWEKYLSFHDQQSLSFSVYNPEEIYFFICHDKCLKRYITPPDNRREWIHYGVIAKNSNIYIYKNKQLLHMVDNLTFRKIYLKTNNIKEWKINNYNLMVSRVVSQPENIILPNDSSCHDLYVYLCSHCTLEIPEISHHFQPLPQVNEFLDPQKLSVWNQTHITLIKNTTNGNFDGYWGVDLRPCPYVKNTKKTMYELKLSGKEETTSIQCKALNSENNSTLARRKRSSEKSSIFKCEPGRLGSECDLNCEDLLGLNHKYCNNHLICEDSACKCSWGFEGLNCNQQCQKGRWGLACENKCTCDNCNHFTGYCPQKTFESSKQVLVAVVIPGILVSLLVTAVIAIKRRQRSMPIRETVPLFTLFITPKQKNTT